MRIDGFYTLYMVRCTKLKKDSIPEGVALSSYLYAVENECGVEGFPGFRTDLRFGVFTVEGNGFFETVQVDTAVRTAIEMFPDIPAARRCKILIQILANVCENFPAAGFSLVHDVMYPLSCSRRNTLARLSLDFTAGTEMSRIFAVSSADCASTSRRMNTTR